MTLGTHASSVLPTHWYQTESAATGDIVRVIGIVAGFFVCLFGYWFFAISTVAVVVGLRHMT